MHYAELQDTLPDNTSATSLQAAALTLPVRVYLAASVLKFRATDWTRFCNHNYPRKCISHQVLPDRDKVPGDDSSDTSDFEDEALPQNQDDTNDTDSTTGDYVLECDAPVRLDTREGIGGVADLHSNSADTRTW
jgi:hypothetical protein